MTPERWRLVKDVFEVVSQQEDPSDRAAHLESLCAGDASLHAEVEAMLASDQAAADFMEDPVLQIPALLARDRVSIGSQIEHYRIVSLLGAGGMGEVYWRRMPGWAGRSLSRYSRPYW